MNRAYLQSLHLETKKNQANQFIASIVNNIKSVASSGATFYEYDILRTSFGPLPVPQPDPIRGMFLQSWLSSLTEFIELLKEAVGDCTITVKVTMMDENENATIVDVVEDASGNLVDASGSVPLVGNMIKKVIHISWD
jgi:hypothetical protein